MTRAKNPDSPAEAAESTSRPEPSAAVPPSSAPDAGQDAALAAEAAAEDTDPYETYPGPGFFHGGRNSPIIAAMARRLEQEGHNEGGPRLGADWTNGHKRAFAAFQHQLRPKEGGDVSGHPDEVAWKKLQVPRVTPLPKTDQKADRT